MLKLKAHVVEAIIESKDAHELVNRLRPNEKPISKDSSPAFVPGMMEFVLLFWKFQNGDARGIAIQLRQPEVPNKYDDTPGVRNYENLGQEASAKRLKGILPSEELEATGWKTIAT